MTDPQLWRRAGHSSPASPIAAEASTEIDADQERESVSPVFEGLLSWPAFVSAVFVLAVLGAIFWPY